MGSALGDIYEHHHSSLNKVGFSIMKEERGRLLNQFIGNGKKILDLGCRDGILTSFFAEGNQVVGTDIDSKVLELAKNNLGIETVLMDLNSDWSELGEKKFDVVVAGEVLEHLYYPDKVVKKIKNVLNQDGLFIGTVPNAFSIKNRLRYLVGKRENTPLADPTHINQLGLKDLKNLLVPYFKSVEIIGLGKYARLSNLFPNHIAFILLFVCKK